jgi:isoquinoline 1-oxidoreductase beta subunit
MKNIAEQTRRTFLKASAAAGGGLLISLYIPEAVLAKGKARTKAQTAASFTPNIWIRIGTDDLITIFWTQLEMGQGVMTAMPMLVAEELDADWNKVRLELVGNNPAYGTPPNGGRQYTAGSRSTRVYWKALREAGAGGRAMLLTAAAQTWNVPEDDCATEKGEVIHKPSGRRLRYGQLVEKASQVQAPKQVTLKQQKDFRLLGQPLARVDIPLKVNGSASYGLDVKRPNMLIARVVHCPVFGGKVASFDGSKSKAVAGVRDVVQLSAGVAVVADSTWAATEGLKVLEVKWDEGPNATLSSEEIRRRFVEAAEKPGAVSRNDGDFAKAMAGGAKTMEAVYEVPYLAHATMEPMNCTADVRSDGCDVWVSTQSQTKVAEVAAQITGLPVGQIQVHPQFIGGGYGRRGEGDDVADAVEASKLMGRPVKVIWAREEDMQHDFYRPVSYARFWAALDSGGTPVAWMQRLVQPSLTARNDPRALDSTNGVDFTSMSGARDVPYNIPNLRVEYIKNDPGIPVGYWRSVGSSVNGYVVESFVDEVAAAAGKDPYEFRSRLLDKSPRHKAVLDLAAQKAGWGTPLPPGRFRGIAVQQANNTYVSEVAEISIGSNGKVRVHRVVAAIDPGWIINPDTIKAQVESSIVYGLTATFYGEITIKNGRVQQNHFFDYPILRINEMPEIEVYIVPSTETPGGVGEPAVPPIASAVVNAIFAATGKRIRKLPLRPEELRTA